MGVWIETVRPQASLMVMEVTPYVGVWIETWLTEKQYIDRKSLLMWECGLKHNHSTSLLIKLSHSLCGSVD